MNGQESIKWADLIEVTILANYGNVGNLKEITLLERTYLDRYKMDGPLSMISPEAQHLLSSRSPDDVYRVIFHAPLRHHDFVVARWDGKIVVAMHSMDVFTEEEMMERLP